MSKLKYLIIHCTATPEGRVVTPLQIFQWHMGPVDLPDGKVRFKGVDYESRAHLPNVDLLGTNIKHLQGRGWKQVGYTDMILLDGSIQNLVPNNDDDIVDPWEITNGVLGQTNWVSRNIVYVGGCANDGKLSVKDTRTQEQREALKAYVIGFIKKHPQVQIAGHNQFDVKGCPSFDVAAWCRSIGIAEHNIYQEPLKVKL